MTRNRSNALFSLHHIISLSSRLSLSRYVSLYRPTLSTQEAALRCRRCGKATRQQQVQPRKLTSGRCTKSISSPIMKLRREYHEMMEEYHDLMKTERQERKQMKLHLHNLIRNPTRTSRRRGRNLVYSKRLLSVRKFMSQCMFLFHIHENALGKQ
jgi:hypothetical protein